MHFGIVEKNSLGCIITLFVFIHYTDCSMINNNRSVKLRKKKCNHFTPK